MKNLLEIYKKYSTPEGKGDKGTIHSYMEIYDYHIKQKENLALLEIGVCEGHSLAMWREFLDGEIFGVDIDISCVKFDLSLCEVIQSDATTPAFPEKLNNKTFDYIIDDGSHFIDHQIKSLIILWDNLKSGGKYFIEDITRENSEILQDFLIQNSFSFEKHDFVNKTGRNDDIIFVIYK